VHPSLPRMLTIVMPALNEERYIEAAIRSVLPEDGAIAYELLVLDGGSTDNTRRIVERLARANPHIKWLANPRRTQSAAMNIAADICHPETTVLVRADCHAHYPPRFAQMCAETLAEKGCQSVVVAMRAIGRTPLQKAFAAAQNSPLGNGGSAHRGSGQSGYVEHGHHAAFDRATFRNLGGYDEKAPFNEDAEFDARLAANGGRIYLDGRLTIDYYPRTTFSSLARQYFRHGWGRANTLKKHAMRPRLRQVLPVAALASCLAALALWPLIGNAALLVPALYFGACLVWGLVLAFGARQPALIFSGPAAVAMHMSWAVGFLTRFAEGTAATAAPEGRNV
jgi:succinoglycan biosynthesis protein ExoA